MLNMKTIGQAVLETERETDRQTHTVKMTNTFIKVNK